MIMKLSTQYNRVSIIVTLAILIVAGLAYYATISYISDNQIDHDLSEEVEEVVQYVNTHHQLPKPVEFDEDQASFKPIGTAVVATRFVDTPFFEPESKRMENGRAIVGTIRLGSVNYQVTVVESKESAEYLLQIIGIITAILCALLFIALFFTNRYILSGLWKPFYHLLNQLKSFTLSKDSAIETSPVKVDEFRELQAAMVNMAERVQNDYQSLKIFTENASHEMMTPLAVINSKLDNLIQDESLNEEQYEQLQDIYAAGNKLSRLNQSLLLLVKIDNQLIKDSENLSLKALLEAKLKEFAEIIKNKGLATDCQLPEDKVIRVSRYLAEILLNNLLSNAIRHSGPNGTLKIRLGGERMVIANTGNPEALDKERIFERFQKGKSSEGLGLGLTIARNICESYHFRLFYEFEAPFHQFIVDFNPTKRQAAVN